MRKWLVILLLLVTVSLQSAPVTATKQYKVCNKTYRCAAGGFAVGLVAIPTFGWVVGMTPLGPVAGGWIAKSMGAAVASGSTIAMVQSFMMTVGPGTYIALGSTGAATFAAMCMCEVSESDVIKSRL